MKSFIAATLLLTVILGLIWINTAVLAKRLDNIETLADALMGAESNERLDAAKRVKDAWGKERLLFALSVNQNELERADDCLSRLCAAAECKSDSDYFITVADLEEALAQVRRLVTLSPEGVF